MEFAVSSPTVVPFRALGERILAAPPRCGPVLLVAVDGPGGAGKSLFAARLAKTLEHASVIHTDDFASWEVPLDWWQRLEAEALWPLEQGMPARFRRYDWIRRSPGAELAIPATGVVILEGVSSSRRAVVDRLSLAVWIESPRPERLARGLARDGVAMRDQWRAWMAEEDKHFGSDRAAERADVVVDGAPTIRHDPEREFVQLR